MWHSLFIPILHVAYVRNKGFSLLLVGTELGIMGILCVRRPWCLLGLDQKGMVLKTLKERTLATSWSIPQNHSNLTANLSMVMLLPHRLRCGCSCNLPQASASCRSPEWQHKGWWWDQPENKVSWSAKASLICWLLSLPANTSEAGLTFLHQQPEN